MAMLAEPEISNSPFGFFVRAAVNSAWVVIGISMRRS
jgi:hypothetical protein